MSRHMIPYGRQDISQDDINAVVEVLKSDFLTQGPQIPSFELCVSEYVDVKHALAVNSATSALHIACLALGLGRGDYLWTTPVTFVASANCGLYCGAKIDFVDIDPQSYNLCPLALKAKLEQAEQTNTLPKVLVAVHLCGQSCDMKAIHNLSKRFGFHVIEDASHAIGGQYKQKPIGNCEYSDITVFSFHPVKIITTCEGGMAVTNSDKLAERLELFRSHGITRNTDLMTKDSEGAWYYEQIDLGYNYRLTDVQAALGRSQMTRLDEYVNKRHELAERYNQLLRDLPLNCPFQHKDCYSSFHLYVIRLDLDVIDVTHRQVFESLRDNNIMVNLHYIPVHLQPFYENMGFSKGDYPEAEKYYSEAISIPLYPSLSFEDQDFVVNCLKRSLDL